MAWLSLASLDYLLEGGDVFYAQLKMTHFWGFLGVSRIIRGWGFLELHDDLKDQIDGVSGQLGTINVDIDFVVTTQSSVFKSCKRILDFFDL